MMIHPTRTVSFILLIVFLAIFEVSAQEGKELIEEKEGHRITPDIRQPKDEFIARLKLPEGFRVNKFAEDLGSPRMMAVGGDGSVYITRRDRGDVVALKDKNGDGRAEERKSVVENLPGVSW